MATTFKRGDPAHDLVELRNYRLRPGTRETLIDLFESAFIDSQEEAGMRIIGQFRNHDDPDSFVWLRSFSNMEARKKALGTFYGSPVWARYRSRANATMINSDNVLLLRPAWPGAGFSAADRASTSSTRSAGAFLATICHLAPRTEQAFVALFLEHLRSALESAGCAISAAFVVARHVNTFPQLPIREGETLFVYFMRFDGLEALQTYTRALADGNILSSELQSDMERRMWRPAETLPLLPTRHSALF